MRLPKTWLRRCALIGLILGSLAAARWLGTRINLNPRLQPGAEIDRFNGVPVFYNGGVDQTFGRHLAPDGYNLGIRFQCVEFVKRYYFARWGHRMPDTFGHARDFYDPHVPDGSLNTRRDLVQFRNGGGSRPEPEDLLVWGPGLLNRFGHVAIVSEVSATGLECVQQNPGPFGNSRARYAIERDQRGNWRVADRRILGWLRRGPTAERSEP